MADSAINNTDYHKYGTDKPNYVKIRVNATIRLSVKICVKITAGALGGQPFRLDTAAAAIINKPMRNPLNTNHFKQNRAGRLVASGTWREVER